MKENYLIIVLAVSFTVMFLGSTIGLCCSNEPHKKGMYWISAILSLMGTAICASGSLIAQAIASI